MWPVMYTFYYRRNVICTGRVIIETSIVVFKNLFYIYNLTTTMYLLFRFTELVMIFHQDLVLFYRYSVEFLCILNFKEILLKNCSHRIEKKPHPANIPNHSFLISYRSKLKMWLIRTYYALEYFDWYPWKLCVNLLFYFGKFTNGGLTWMSCKICTLTHYYNNQASTIKCIRLIIYCTVKGNGCL